VVRLNFFAYFFLIILVDGARKPLRKTVDFRQFMGKSKSQGQCGSCYAQAATTMLEARIRRKYQNVLKKYVEQPKVKKLTKINLMKIYLLNLIGFLTLS
jgi:bacterioferritin-associated ferredoxin